MLVDWILFPLILLVLCAGCGLAIARASGQRIQAPLVLPVGLAALIVVASAATASDLTARAATPLVVVLAITGFVVAPDRRACLPGRWPAAAAAGVFAVFAAPVVLSGQATFTGYIQLDDIATWLALTDQVMQHGRDLTGLAASTHEATLANYLPGGYPVGAFLALGVGHELTGADIAWLFDPTMACLAALLALSLTSVAGSVVERPRARAAVAFVAAQAALLASYAEWGAIKEVTAAALVALVAALSPALLGAPPAGPPDPAPAEPSSGEERRPLRRGSALGVLPLAVACAALLAALSAGGVVWIAPVLAAAVVAARPRAAPLLRSTPLLLVGVAVLSIPSLLLAKTFVAPEIKAGSVLSAATELGNLRGPLGQDHLLGIWPAGDFRFAPSAHAVTGLLIAIVLVMALAGLALAWQRRAAPLVAYVAGGLVACELLISRGSPWVDAKAMATAAPMALTAALAGLAAVAASPTFGAPLRRIATAVIVVLGAGVLWSNALGYRQAYLAPRGQLGELQSAGTLLAGQGPTLMTEYEPYGARHFLRRADAESASELRRRVIPLRNGAQLQKSAAADIDAFDPVALRDYRSLVLRTSPLASRPPSAYHRLRAGLSYDVWQRPARPPAPFVADLPLGGASAPGAVPSCAAVRGLAQRAGRGGRLVAVARRAPVVGQLGASERPASWALASADAVIPTGGGRLTVDVRVPAAARYAVWLGGSTRGTTTITVDGRPVGAISGRLNNQGGMMRFGDVVLPAGSHRVVLSYADGGLRPGTRGQVSTPLPLGPVVLAAPESAPEPYSVPAARAGELCGRYLDWIEAHAAGA